MSSNEGFGAAGDGGFTTNEHDRAEAEKIKAMLEKKRASESSGGTTNVRTDNLSTNDDDWPLPSVSIDEGANKYVQIHARASAPSSRSGKKQTFVISRRGASYHRNVAEWFLPSLEEKGYENVSIEGGGRIFMDEDKKKISVFGYSYSFGRADHALSKKVIEEDERYKGYDVTWSNEGY